MSDDAITWSSHRQKPAPAREVDSFAKMPELDAIRGIAAIVVFSGHFCEGLVPGATASVNGTLLFTVLNGPAAVIVFFVLSGFVLTLRPLRAQGWIPLVSMIAKRWPRLAGPVAVAGLAYCAAALIGAFPRPDVLGFPLPPNAPAYWFWGQAQHNEQIGPVLREALVGTFVSESAEHNGVLWTMHWEFLGSFLVAGLAAIVLLKRPVVVRVALFAMLWIAAATYSGWLMAFPMGLLGAALHNRLGMRIRIGGWLAIGCALCGAALLSWDIRLQTGVWAWTAVLGDRLRFSLWVVAESIAAGMWMAVALYNPVIRRCLSGRIASLAGRMSFSLYLIHLLVLCTLSSWLSILLVHASGGVVVGAGLYLVSIGASLLLAIPLMMFDQWWIRVLGHVARVVFTPGQCAEVAPEA